jgi:hypothetical protein
MRSSGSGSVVAYNYMDDSWDFDSPTWVEVGLNASHMAGPHHVLFEGNYFQNVNSDYTHGNSGYLTFFRNWLSGQRRDFTDTQNVRTASFAAWSLNDSFVGNIIGYSSPSRRCATASPGFRTRDALCGRREQRNYDAPNASSSGLPSSKR